MDPAKNSQDDSAPTLIVVEDHLATRTMLVDWLGAVFPNYHCLGASSGEEALELVRVHGPALVVMDYALPGLNGIETTRRLKQLVPGVGVIMLSMYEAEAYQAEAATAGASAYLFKRTMYTQFIPTVQALLALAGDHPTDRGLSESAAERGTL
jgi:DNA-binding NarL/FixJ family response regulator